MFSQLLSHVPWLHVLVAAVAFFALGAVWYSPVLFSKTWVKAAGINMEDPNAKKGMAGAFVTSFILMFITCIGIAVMQPVLPTIDAMGGLKLGLLIGVCFAFTSISIAYVYQKKPMALHLIDGGYQIVGCAIASMILAAWH